MINEDDGPIIMLDLSEKNVMSILGKVLNPDCQRKSNLVLDMPRKWGMVNRVRGVVLFKDRVQFIFKYEEDIKDILNQTVHMYND